MPSIELLVSTAGYVVLDMGLRVFDFDFDYWLFFLGGISGNRIKTTTKMSNTSNEYPINEWAIHSSLEIAIPYIWQTIQ